MDDDLELPVGPGEREDEVLLDEVFGDELGVDLLGDAVAGEIDVLHAELVGEGLGDLLFLDEAGLDERLAQALAGGARLGGGGLHLLGLDHAPSDEDFTEFLAGSCHAVLRLSRVQVRNETTPRRTGGES
jgi:hypothetical protein